MIMISKPLNNETIRNNSGVTVKKNKNKSVTKPGIKHRKCW